MCGIAGVVRYEGPVADDPQALADTLSAALAHRGPDGYGSWLSADRDVLLVHRRLAIIDPRPEAGQPMASSDGHSLIVFNGEVYNYRELRGDLEARGEQFVTASDTEILLRLVDRDGPSALARVRGMFALACWDRRDHSLLVARDRFGIKPLYVSRSPNAVAFASELGALRAAGVVDGRPSPAGVLAFLTWGSVPGTLTWLNDARMLAPGTWWCWGQDGRDVNGTFADVRDAYRSGTAAPQESGAFRETVSLAVRDSVRAHLVADVPVAVFLSGGIDSSAIVSAAASLGATNLQTFTVGFDDPSSEAADARRVASAFGMRHEELHIDASAVEADLPGIVRRLDQPTIDAVNSFCVSKAVAAAGIKAVLSGAGGDELFGGYESFSRLPRALRITRQLGGLWPFVAPLGQLVVPARAQARWRHFVHTNGSLVDVYRVARGFLMPEELSEMAGPALRDLSAGDAFAELGAVEEALLAPTGAESPYAAVARLESRLYLGGQLLRDIDVMGMAHGLEVRVPFVDHQLLGAVWPELGRHVALMRNKRLLHESLARPLPAETVRRPKQGFTLPFERWMGGGLAPFVRDGLEQLAEREWIGRHVPARVWADWISGASHWSRPWGLAVLGHFLRPQSA